MQVPTYVPMEATYHFLTLHIFCNAVSHSQLHVLFTIMLSFLQTLMLHPQRSVPKSRGAVPTASPQPDSCHPEGAPHHSHRRGRCARSFFRNPDAAAPEVGTVQVFHFRIKSRAAGVFPHGGRAGARA